MTFTLFSDESRDRQDGLWAELRAERAAVRSDDGFWTVTRYDDVWEVLHAPDRFSSAPNQGEALGLSMDLSPDADPRREATAAIGQILPELAHRRLDIASLERLPSALVHGYRTIELHAA